MLRNVTWCVLHLVSKCNLLIILEWDGTVMLWCVENKLLLYHTFLTAHQMIFGCYCTSFVSSCKVLHHTILCRGIWHLLYKTYIPLQLWCIIHDCLDPHKRFSDICSVITVAWAWSCILVWRLQTSVASRCLQTCRWTLYSAAREGKNKNHTSFSYTHVLISHKYNRFMFSFLDDW